VLRHGIDISRPGSHEIRASAGDDPAGKAAAVQQPEQLQHRLVHRLRVRPPEARMPGRRQPTSAQTVELGGGDARVGERQKLDEGCHSAGLQLFEAGRMT
jgi:hypothetical protein